MDCKDRTRITLKRFVAENIERVIRGKDRSSEA